MRANSNRILSTAMLAASAGATLVSTPAPAATNDIQPGEVKTIDNVKIKGDGKLHAAERAAAKRKRQRQIAKQSRKVNYRVARMK